LVDESWLFLLAHGFQSCKVPMIDDSIGCLDLIIVLAIIAAVVDVPAAWSL